MLNDYTTHINYESSVYSLTFDRQDCNVREYEPGRILASSQPVKTMNHVFKEAPVINDEWYDILQGGCTISVDDTQVIITRSDGNDGRIIYDLSTDSYEWTYEYSLKDSNKNGIFKHGFTFVCDGSDCSRVEIAGKEEKGTKLKEELKDKKIKIGRADFDLKENTHGYTWALKSESGITIVDFTHAKGATEIGRDVIVDPTFGYTAGTIQKIQSNAGTGAACAEASFVSYGAGEFVFLPTTGDSSGCIRTAVEWDVSSITDGSTIDNVNLRYDVTATPYSTRNCDFTPMETYHASTDTLAEVWGDISDSASYVDNDASCTTIADDKVLDLGTTADSQLETDLAGDQFSVGVKFDNEVRGGSYYGQSISGGGKTYDLEVDYTEPPPGEWSPGPPIFDNVFQYDIGSVNGSWTASNATGVDDYYFWWDLDNVAPFTAGSNAGGNYTNATMTGLNNGTLYYFNVTASSLNNGTGSNVLSLTTWDVPDAPTDANSEATAIDAAIIRWNNGTANGRDHNGFGIRFDNGTGAWQELIFNTTNTIPNYNYTGGEVGDTINFQVRGSTSIMQWGAWSSNITIVLLQDTTASVTVAYLNQGDAAQFNTTVSITGGSTDPVKVSQLRLMRNGTGVKTLTVDQDIAQGGSWVFNGTGATIWWQITDNNPYNFTVQATVQNTTGTIVFEDTGNEFTREYTPDYFTAITSSEGLVNYTLSRADPYTSIEMDVNRHKGGDTFQVECIYQTGSQAAVFNTTGVPLNGIWVNRTGVGYYNTTVPVTGGENYYITCYNDNPLFTTISYTNSSLASFGIAIFDNVYGGMIGVPVGVFFILLAAGMASARTAPTYIVAVLAIAGLMTTMGFFTLDTAVWGLALIAGAVGLLVGRKFF